MQRSRKGLRGLSLCCVAVAAVTACGETPSLGVPVVAQRDGRALDCSTTSVTHLALYLSDVQLRGSDGQWRQARLAKREQQSANTALLKLLPCRPDQPPATITLQRPDGGSTGLRFTVGVAAQDNHLDPTTAAPPLNDSPMFWTWQQGYKFLSLEGSGPGGGYVLHLGSTGCVSPAPVRPPKEPCARPNRLQVTVDDFDVTEDGLAIELGDLVRRLGTHRCTGNYHDKAACRDALAVLGIEADSGGCPATCGREVFLRQKKRI